MRVISYLSAFAFSLALVACGGGGGGGDEIPPAANITPTADAGTAKNEVVGTVATLNGSASSDGDGDALSYVWTLTGQPPGSSATLPNVTSATPNFVPDIAGTYTATLIVNDGKVNSSAATVLITTTGSPNGLERLYGALTLNYMFTETTTSTDPFTDTVIYSPQNLSSDGTILSALSVGNPARAMTCGLSPATGLNRTYLCHILDAANGWTEMFLFNLNGGQIANGLYEFCYSSNTTIESCTADLFATPDGFIWGSVSP
jgi:hypothetical protein